MTREWKSYMPAYRLHVMEAGHDCENIMREGEGGQKKETEATKVRIPLHVFGLALFSSMS